MDRQEQYKLLRIVEQSNNVRDIAIIKILLNTGLRIQGLCHLCWIDITLSDRKGTLIVKNGKGDKRREIPLNKDARYALEFIEYVKNVENEHRFFQGQRGTMTPSGIQILLKKYLKRAEIEIISPHQLRHFFYKNLVDVSIGLEKIALMADHESLETTRRYCEPSLRDLQKAVDLIGEEE